MAHLLRVSAPLTLCLLLLAGCAFVMPPTREPVTIRFVFPPFGAGREAYEELAAAFEEEHPYITVELVQRAPWQAGASEGDVITVFGELIWTLREDETIVALDPYIQQDEQFDLEDLHPSAAAYFSYEQERWAIPAGLDVSVIYYNRDLFDQAGVPYPSLDWTWDDFFAKAVELRDPLTGVYGYAAVGSGLNANWDVVSFIYQHGGRIVDDLYEPTVVTFDDPLTIEALEWYARLAHEYDAILTPERSGDEYDSNNPSVAIVSDKVAMWLDSFSGMPEIVNTVNWGMAPLPRDARAFTPASIFGYALSAEAVDAEACWLWISYLSRQPPAGMLPVRRSVLESEEYENRVGGDVVDVAIVSLEGAEVVSYITLYTGMRREMDLFTRGMSYILRGTLEPAEAMDEAQYKAQ